MAVFLCSHDFVVLQEVQTQVVVTRILWRSSRKCKRIPIKEVDFKGNVGSLRIEISCFDNSVYNNSCFHMPKPEGEVIEVEGKSQVSPIPAWSTHGLKCSLPVCLQTASIINTDLLTRIGICTCYAVNSSKSSLTNMLLQILHFVHQPRHQTFSLPGWWEVLDEPICQRLLHLFVVVFCHILQDLISWLVWLLTTVICQPRAWLPRTSTFTFLTILTVNLGV